MSSARNRSTLDHRAPLVVDTRELGRRPGSMRESVFTAAAPVDLATPLVGVPVGAPMEIELRMESVVEGVLVTAVVTAPLAGECGRCLDPFTDEITVDVQELYYYPERTAELGGDASEDETLEVDGDLLDLEPPVRDAIVLALPLTPLCEDDCPGLDSFGVRRSSPAPEPEPEVDARWAGLSGIAVGELAPRTS